MTVLNTQPARNDITRSLYDRREVRYTDRDDPTAPSSLLPGATENKPNAPTDALPVIQKPPSPAGAPLPHQGIDGVVAEVRADSIAIQCRVSGQSVEISLPTILVPHELQSYGQAVSLSLDSSGGYQRPVVRRRSPLPRAPLPGEAEADAWVDSL
jgi:hypothetical protein